MKFHESSRNGIVPPGVLLPIGDVNDGRGIVLGKTYRTRQASLLLKFAKSTSDAELSAKLISKAAELASQTDPLAEDQSLKAPDVDPDDGTGAA
jgi:hypothetical protein